MYQNQQTQNNLTEKSIFLNEEYLTGCNYPNRNSLPKVKELDNQPKIDWQQILYSLTELSPFPIGIVCLESQQVLFKNELLASFLEIEPSQRFDKIIPSFYDQPTLWAKLVNNLKSGNLIKNCAVEVKKANGDIFKAEISAKVVKYEDKLAALFIFMNSTEHLNEHLKTQHEDFSLTAAVQEIADPIDFTYSRCNLVDVNLSIVSTTNNPNVQSVEKISPLQEPEVDLHLMERAIAASSNGIILTDPNQPDNPIIYVNPAFELITGYCASEVIGRNCRFLQGNDLEQVALQELRSAIQEQRECHVILRNYRKDNFLFWNELYLAPVFDNSGYLTNFIGIQTDITHHLQALEALGKQEEQYRRIVQTATEGIWLLDKDNCTTFVNQQMATMLGYTIEEMLGATLFSFMDSEGLEIANSCLSRRYQGIQEAHDFKFRCQDGSDLWAIISCAPLLDDQGNYAGALGMVTNITDRKLAEAALQESKQRLDGILCSLEDVIWSISADTFETLYLNPAALKVYGYSVSEFFENSNLWFEVIHPEDQQQVHAAIQPLFLTEKQELEYRIVRPDGQVRWLLNRSHLIYNASGLPIRIDGIATDITERKLLEEKLVHNAFYDALTGLPNRILFIDRLEQAIAQMKHNPDDLFAVLFLDLDRFKVVNDSLGHLVGDQLLVTLAQRLQQCLQPDDTVARLGGDEFTILLSHIQTIEDATDIAKHIHQALKPPFNLCGYEVFMTASIGIALGTNKYVQPADLLRDADTALYRAKEQSQAGHIVFDTTMYDRAVELLQLETDLRWAVERQELCIFYQPIICIKTGKITGFEALVRWQHPERGLISPTEFIPVAEETGLIIPIGQWVLTESCKQLRQWQLQFPAIKPLTLNVNLSGKQFSQPHLIEQISQILQDTGLSSSNLKLEITETAIIASPQKATSILKQLKAFGLQLCIDDFGTGYSSLAYLHNFPIDVLKIDRSFVNRIDSDTEQFAIVRAIVTLADNLGMSVVAEGVETINQLAQLQLLQCQQAQGYLFSKPLDQEQARNLLASGQSFLRI
ncbi:EAL and GGDEF domain-containing protein [Nostoc punctiforme]|uniref:Diguanylate cyclase/phosphodiesterase with PAS/PAC and GAF sensor(S) n=1 Tax=Nostoc punctiforme (strain ATCC 29133 / PCC 73102) TaxID=63737 RepID=B2JAQ5_NOSP7|nr:bifunctional diguanylate cyclase/phosphodiesterase [Nostoc punctiforme]ACC85009.1 diguanylate cyclase/phosphodiesterase with PAS/PAC and GAF sensor(s) [Nostoc punctiforme PCC 73102]